MSDLLQVPGTALADASTSIQFFSYDEIKAYPGWRYNVDPSKTKLVSMFGWYSLLPMVPCALSCCHHEHTHGVMAITSDGEVVNIGTYCGRTHFPDRFESEHNALKSRRRMHSYREQIGTFVASKGQHFERLCDLKERDQGGTWQNTLALEFAKVLPHEVMRELRQRAQRDITAVHYERVMSREEMEEEDIRNGVDPEEGREKRPIRYARDLLGHLNGLRIWARPIRKVLVEELETELRAVVSSNYYDIRTETPLRKLAKATEEIERLFREAEVILLEGRAFFAKQNLELITQFQLASTARVNVTRAVRAFCSRHSL